jgi:uncharacterized protein (DUF697 family)
MKSIGHLTNLWDNLREADLRPLRDQALHGIDIAIVGEPGSGRSALADQMRRDPNRPQLSSESPVRILDLENAAQAANAFLIILVIPARQADITREQELVRLWQNNARRVLVFVNQPDEAGEALAISTWTSRGMRRVVIGSPADTRFLLEKFAPAVVEILPDKLLALGRFFPLFRLPVARYLINDTCFSNAAYSLSTGLAEIVAVLSIPITVADSFILTKAQAFLVYKLGLALGYSTRWQDYIAEFGGVLGSGFVWRQVARSLIGLIPVWGIVPKTAIAYAGTYVVGNVVLQWYLTGKHLSKQQMQATYKQALGHGKDLARRLIERLPRALLWWPRLPRLRLPGRSQRADKALPAPRVGADGIRPPRPRPKKRQLCPNCGKTSARDASFCQYCGAPLT